MLVLFPDVMNFLGTKIALESAARVYFPVMFCVFLRPLAYPSTGGISRFPFDKEVLVGSPFFLLALLGLPVPISPSPAVSKLAGDKGRLVALPGLWYAVDFWRVLVPPLSAPSLGSLTLLRMILRVEMGPFMDGPQPR